MSPILLLLKPLPLTEEEDRRPLEDAGDRLLADEGERTLINEGDLVLRKDGSGARPLGKPGKTLPLRVQTGRAVPLRGKTLGDTDGALVKNEILAGCSLDKLPMKVKGIKW